VVKQDQRGAIIPTSSPSDYRTTPHHPEDYIIHAEQLACIDEHLVAIARQRQRLSVQAEALLEHSRAAMPGSAEWAALMQERLACGTQRTLLVYAWCYWSDSYLSLRSWWRHTPPVTGGPGEDVRAQVASRHATR
jgi:hypothetical protein